MRRFVKNQSGSVTPKENELNIISIILIIISNQSFLQN